MSFILDALKKSEGERQRQSGPALFEVKVAPPGARFPAWAAILAALLAVNLGIVAWLATRDSPEPVGNETAARGEPASPADFPVAPAPQVAEPEPPAPAVARSTPQPAASDEPVIEDDDYEEPELVASDPEPVAPARPSRVLRGTGLGIPTYEQLAGAPGSALPELRLDLHVFASEPADRFIFLNNRRLREGEALPDGTRVESIVPDGAVLSARGERFLLQSP